MICNICKYNYQDLRHRLDAIENELELRIRRYSVSSRHEEAFSKKEECQELLDFIRNLSGSITYQVWMNTPMDKCSTCTNSKGCITCENQEQWEGKPINKI